MLGRDQIINTATSPSSSAAVAPSDCDFEVRFSIRKKDTDGQVAFKLDGGRFKKTELQEPCPDIYLRTYKFICDAVYKITITSRPNVVFNFVLTFFFSELNISGNSMELHLDNGVYSTEWDTTVFPVTAKGSREYLSLCLQVSFNFAPLFYRSCAFLFQ
ncbi:unnamed protein product [Gongylonema pulchrum]|uniref:CB1 cannabinoid receptor-interacting protein 1 n=1 Tax=Gongylonema pulchrum TaxID=637853 RepID=A0A183DZQ6_9BILA|nr:unnamed protein product [Gongylonema pulchrum]